MLCHNFNLFSEDAEFRLSKWKTFRESLIDSTDPLYDTQQFWRNPPFVAYNSNVDPYNEPSWPTPWEIIVDNKYDDFTKALMIGYTLKLTERYKNSNVALNTYIDIIHNRQYNIICVEELWAVNFNDDRPVLIVDLPVELNLTCSIIIKSPH